MRSPWIIFGGWSYGWRERWFFCRARGLRFLESAAFPLDRQDLSPMDEPIDQGDNTGRVREDLVPFGKQLSSAFFH